MNQAQVNAIMAAVTAAMQNASNTEKNDNGKSGFGTHSGEECKIVLSRRVGLTVTRGCGGFPQEKVTMEIPRGNEVEKVQQNQAEKIRPGSRKEARQQLNSAYLSPNIIEVVPSYSARDLHGTGYSAVDARRGSTANDKVPPKAGGGVAAAGRIVQNADFELSPSNKDGGKMRVSERKGPPPPHPGVGARIPGEMGQVVGASDAPQVCSSRKLYVRAAPSKAKAAASSGQRRCSIHRNSRRSSDRVKS